MKSPKSPKNTSLYSRLALITSVTLVVGYFVVYAVYQNIEPEEVASNATITSTLMGKIKNNLDTLNTQVSNFGFSSGNVGIGMTNPVTKFGVKQTENTAVTSTSFWNALFGGIDIQNPSTTANTIAGIRFLNQDGVSGIGSIQESSTLSALAFFAGGAGVASTVPERMRIASNGNVGIGTTTPTVKLEVNGKFTAQDTIQFQGGAKIRQMVVKRGTLPNANGGPYYGFGPAFPKAVLDSSKCIGFATPIGALTGTSILVTWAGMADTVNSYFSCSNCTASTQFSFMVIEYE